MGNRRVELYLVMLGNYFSSLKHNNYLDSFLLSLLIIKWSSQQVKTANIKPEHNYGLVIDTSDMSGEKYVVIKPLPMMKCFSFQHSSLCFLHYLKYT